MAENLHEYKKKPPIGLISGFSCLVETEGLKPNHPFICSMIFLNSSCFSGDTLR